jgi:hypothetical protein
VCGNGSGVPWAVCRRRAEVRGDPLASISRASFLNACPKASSSSASRGPALPLANRKHRSAWTCRCSASDTCIPVNRATAWAILRQSLVKGVGWRVVHHHCTNWVLAAARRPATTIGNHINWRELSASRCCTVVRRGNTPLGYRTTSTGCKAHSRSNFRLDKSNKVRPVRCPTTTHRR